MRETKNSTGSNVVWCVVLASSIPNHVEIIENKHNGYLYDLKRK